MTTIVIIGGFGNFGKRISHRLARHLKGLASQQDPSPLVSPSPSPSSSQSLSVSPSSLQSPLSATLIIASRSCNTEELHQLQDIYPHTHHTVFDANRDSLENIFGCSPQSTSSSPASSLSRNILVSCVGPFDSFRIPLQALRYQCHYLDLADSRQYVEAFPPFFHEKAKHAGLVFITGASTAPAITSAAIDRAISTCFKSHNRSADSGDDIASSCEKEARDEARVELREEVTERIPPLWEYDCEVALSTGGQVSKGLSTVQSVLQYAGAMIPRIVSSPPATLHDNAPPTFHSTHCYGWQDTHRTRLYALGGVLPRLVSNVDVPENTLMFAKKYPFHSLIFQAGVQQFYHNRGSDLLGRVLNGYLRLRGPRRESHLDEGLENISGPQRVNRALSPFLLRVSDALSPLFGHKDGGMTVSIYRRKGGVTVDTEAVKQTERGQGGGRLVYRWSIIGADNAGPEIPSTPAVVLTKRLLRAIQLSVEGEHGVDQSNISTQSVAISPSPTMTTTEILLSISNLSPGAYPCVSMMSVEEIMNDIKETRAPVYHYEQYRTAHGEDASRVHPEFEKKKTGQELARCGGERRREEEGEERKGASTGAPYLVSRVFEDCMPAGEFARLPEPIRVFHSRDGSEAECVLEIARGRGLAGFLARVLGIPPSTNASRVIVKSSVLPCGSYQWLRFFDRSDSKGPSVFRSVLQEEGGMLTERVYSPYFPSFFPLSKLLWRIHTPAPAADRANIGRDDGKRKVLYSLS